MRSLHDVGGVHSLRVVLLLLLVSMPHCHRADKMEERKKRAILRGFLNEISQVSAEPGLQLPLSSSTPDQGNDVVPNFQLPLSSSGVPPASPAQHNDAQLPLSSSVEPPTPPPKPIDDQLPVSSSVLRETPILHFEPVARPACGST